MTEKITPVDGEVLALINNKLSMAGSLAKYYKNLSTKEMVNELQEERRKGDRY